MKHKRTQSFYKAKVKKTLKKKINAYEWSKMKLKDGILRK